MSRQTGSVSSPRRGRARVFVAGAVLGLAAGWLVAHSGRAVEGTAGHDAVAPGTAGAPGAGAEPAGRGQLWTCGMHPQVIQDHPGNCPICGMKLTPLVTEGSGADHGLVIDPVVVQNMGVRTAEARLERLHRTLRVSGNVTETEPARTDVTLRVSGWIEKLHATTEGMHVSAGEPLFDLYSPELTVGIDELIAARHGLDAEAGAASGADGAGGFGRELFEAAKRKLLLYGLSAGQVDQLAALERAPERVPFLSPRDGHVMERHVLEGSAVQPGELLFRLSDTSVMWVEAHVHEQDLPFISLGAAVRATTPAAPGRVFRGEVTFIHPHLDEASRTALVRATVRNPTEQLRLGMWATVEIEAGAEDPVLVVPQASVLDSGVRRLVWVSLGEGHFEPHEVQLGSRGDDGLVEVLHGLSIGDMVVTSGQFLVDSESRLREAIAKQLAEGLSAPSASTHDLGR